jgi:hypothetical protein
VNKGIQVNTERKIEREAVEVLRAILQDELGFELNVRYEPGATRGYDVVIEATAGRAKFRFGIQARSRITPQVALSIFEGMHRLSKELIPILYAPVVSPRVAEIARSEGISFFDLSGNCRLHDRDRCMLIERRGFKSERMPHTPSADPFATRSSRIVRALLTRPTEGWQVRRLAEHSDVRVSVGLAAKVKHALIEHGYAIEHDRRLYLRDPIALLNAWTERYTGPAQQIPMYFRGDPNTAEQSATRWCEGLGLRYALASYSAAWRLAPEVRYSVASVYVEDRGFERPALDMLAADHGAKRVETGPNLFLWRTFDSSVFASSERLADDAAITTSPLQTYLDLKRTPGRGEGAAGAVYEKCLLHGLQAAADRAKEWSHATV